MGERMMLCVWMGTMDKGRTHQPRQGREPLTMPSDHLRRLAANRRMLSVSTGSVHTLVLVAELVEVRIAVAPCYPKHFPCSVTTAIMIPNNTAFAFQLHRDIGGMQAKGDQAFCFLIRRSCCWRTTGRDGIGARPAGRGTSACVVVSG